MPSSIGIRFYRFVVCEKRESAPLSLTTSELNKSVPEFIDSFIQAHSSTQQNNELERSWFFEPIESDSVGSSRGLVRYGTFGFESDFVDTKTKKKNYRRKTTDTEEIPLYYEFWCPTDGSNFGLVAFQSFQGRSCITLVMNRLQKLFEHENEDYAIRYKKLLPNDAKGSAYYSAPVKKLRLIKRQASSDIADQYFNPADVPEEIDLELILSARRKKSFGNLASLMNHIKSTDGSIVTHDGISFPEAVAQISIGGRPRQVGILGANSDAGTIDLTDAVDWHGGHPTFASLRREANTLMQDFHSTLVGE